MEWWRVVGRITEFVIEHISKLFAGLFVFFSLEEFWS